MRGAVLRWVLWLGALSGCGETFPLSQVPIEGGTAEQRALVAEELASFERWVGAGRVELRSIRFEGEGDDPAGGYYRRSKRVTLAPTLTGASLRQIARHELCHALDYQDGLLDRPDTAFDVLFGRVEAAGGFGAGPDTERFKRSEILAETCELGPSVARLLQPCPGDPPDLAPVAKFLVDHVWTGDVDLHADPVPTEPPVGRVGPFAPEDVVVVGGADGASARVALLGDDQVDDAWVDLSTGDEIEEAPGYDASGRYDVAPEVPVPAGVWALPPSATETPLHTVVQGDRALLVVRAAASSIGAELGPMAPRAIVLDGDRWRPVDACPGDVATVFTTPDQLWLAWAEGSRVQWAPVTP